MRNFTLFLLITFVATSCSRNKHLTADYDKFASQHSGIAVLPYDIQLKGRKTAEMTDAEIYDVRSVESKLFQQSLYNEVLERTGARNKDINISVQDINKTNRLLVAAGIDLVDISEYGPRELGEVLGVDAIISTKLIKDMFFSREEALLVDVASEAAEEILGNRLPLSVRLYPKSKLTRSAEVDIYCTIVDTDAESAIWVYNTECDLQWDMDPDDAIERINGRISKKFPYRKD